jgi:hypothetical protein
MGAAPMAATPPNWLTAFGVLARVLSHVPERSLRSIYREHFWQCFRTRRDPVVAMLYAIRCASHYHMHRLVRVLAITHSSTCFNIGQVTGRGEELSNEDACIDDGHRGQAATGIDSCANLLSFPSHRGDAG